MSYRYIEYYDNSLITHLSTYYSNLSYPESDGDSNVALIVGGFLGSILLIIVALACILIPIIVTVVKHENHDHIYIASIIIIVDFEGLQKKEEQR